MRKILRGLGAIAGLALLIGVGASHVGHLKSQRLDRLENVPAVIPTAKVIKDGKTAHLHYFKEGNERYFRVLESDGNSDVERIVKYSEMIRKGYRIELEDK